MKVFLIAGEPSGDLLGARLMAALKQRGVSNFCGVGGARMVEQGLTSLFPMTDLALFGLAEILPKIPLILRRLRETADAIKREKPDVVITIDAPDFSFRVARKLKGSGIRFVHYVAPTVWAWRPGRAKKIQPLFNHLLALFPFEPPYFHKVGLDCSFVGHPLVEAGIEQADGSRFISKYNLKADQPILVLLPGSRRSEIGVLLNDFEKTLALLKPVYPNLQVVMPAVPHLLEDIRGRTATWPFPVLLVTGDGDKYDAFKAATAALAASGTVALELGLAGTPAAVAYRLHPLTYLLYRRLIKVGHVNLVNIMAGRTVVPELLQQDCTPEKMAETITQLLVANNPARLQQIEGLQRVRQWLSPQGNLRPSEAAADVVLKVASETADV